MRKPGNEDVKVAQAEFTEIPPEAEGFRVSYLPPMSGLADREFVKQPGEIGFLIGQGQTAQVLRNLCHAVYTQQDGEKWHEIVDQIGVLFGVKLLDPQYEPHTSEIIMMYDDHGVQLDLSSAGRGLQQTLLLLAHLHAHPGEVLLLDEPDAHLEILRQRQIYQAINQVAREQNGQIIAASHSEVVLNEAAGTGTVVAFVGKPHTITDKGSQVKKSLTDIGWDKYYQAEEQGWILFLEDSSDLAVLRSFAQHLNHPAASILADHIFVHYISTNLPQRARELFHGLKEGCPKLIGLAIFDRLEKELQPADSDFPLKIMQWKRREIENYLAGRDVLLSFAAKGLGDEPLLWPVDRCIEVMKEAMREVINAKQVLDESFEPWSSDIKATDDLLDPVFHRYFRKLDLPLLFRKSDYHQLASLVSVKQVDPDITVKLDAIVEVAEKAESPSQT